MAVCRRVSLSQAVGAILVLKGRRGVVTCLEEGLGVGPMGSWRHGRHDRARPRMRMCHGEREKRKVDSRRWDGTRRKVNS